MGFGNLRKKTKPGLKKGRSQGYKLQILTRGRHGKYFCWYGSVFSEKILPVLTSFFNRWSGSGHSRKNQTEPTLLPTIKRLINMRGVPQDQTNVHIYLNACIPTHGGVGTPLLEAVILLYILTDAYF